METMGNTSQNDSTNAYNGETSLTRRRTMNTINNSSASNQNPWHKLYDVLVETILALLPVADYFRCQFVCKRWMSLIHTPTFTTTCQKLFIRPPWFFMLDEENPADFVYDMEVNNWRHARLPVSTDINGRPRTLVATSGSLMCFMSETGALTVCNPLTGSARTLPRLNLDRKVKVITMNALGSSFKVFVFSGKLSNMTLRMFSSMGDAWTEFPVRMILAFQDRVRGGNTRSVVKWTAMKELAGVTTIGSNGQVLVYYLSHHGRLLCCDTQQGTLRMYPRLFSVAEEYAIDLVECGGRVLIVVLREATGTATLKIWEFDQRESMWKEVAVMPRDMSQAYYGLEADINCAGHGVYVMVCVNSKKSGLNQVVMCDITEDFWVNLPACIDQHSGCVKKFVSASSFMPNIEPNV